MFDEIIVGLAALEAKIATINARPLPSSDMKYAQAELNPKPARSRKRVAKARATKPKG